VRRRLLLGLLGAGVVVVALQVAWQARQVEADLTGACDLLAGAGGFQAGALPERLALIDRADARVRSAGARLGGWPLRQLGGVPLLGRDVRVARAVDASAADAIRATRRVVAAVEPLQQGRLSRATIGGAAGALLALHTSLDRAAARVRATRPLLAAGGPRAEYLATAAAASRTAADAGQGLRLAATLYGPAGQARWFLALQNPAELRGTGGLIGQYGILESSPAGPRLVTVAPYEQLEDRTHRAVPVPHQVAVRYGRFAVDRAWSAVDIPPDLPTVGRIVTRLYRSVTGERIDGMVATDPLAVAAVLRVAGPITAGGVLLDGDNVARLTLVDAYVRYAADNDARRRFLTAVARGTFAALQRALRANPVELAGSLAAAARGRHLQVYASDPVAEAALARLGLAGGAMAPAAGDYLMPVGVNAGGNKLGRLRAGAVAGGAGGRQGGEGAGAAAVVPSSLALLRAAYPDGRARARAFGVWGGAGVADGSGGGVAGVELGEVDAVGGAEHGAEAVAHAAAAVVAVAEAERVAHLVAGDLATRGGAGQPDVVQPDRAVPGVAAARIVVYGGAAGLAGGPAAVVHLDAVVALRAPGGEPDGDPVAPAPAGRRRLDVGPVGAGRVGPLEPDGDLAGVPAVPAGHGGGGPARQGDHQEQGQGEQLLHMGSRGTDGHAISGAGSRGCVGASIGKSDQSDSVACFGLFRRKRRVPVVRPGGTCETGSVRPAASEGLPTYRGGRPACPAWCAMRFDGTHPPPEPLDLVPYSHVVGRRRGTSLVRTVG
jgi:Protein of unknown function (DUF4012)